MPTYVRKDADGNAVEKISPELGGPEDIRLAAACRGDEPVWTVQDAAEQTVTPETAPEAAAERAEMPAVQGRAPKGPQAAKKAENGGESSDG